MKRAVDVAKELENEYSTTFQEPVFGWLGTHDSAVSPLIGVCTLSVRVGDPRNPEVDKTLISPLKLAYLASMIRHNLKVLLVRNYRGAFQVVDVDIYQEIANFAGSYPAPNIIINLEGEGITGILPRDHGGTGTDLSTTGGTSRILFQESTNSDITVRVLANADLPTTISGKTFTGDTVSDYLAFTEVSTPSAPANTAGRLYARDVLGFTRFGYIDSNSLIVDISRDRTTEFNNATGSTIAALRVVRVNGASGSTPFQPTATPAQGNSVANADGVIGVTIASVNNGSNGRLMLHGLMTADTSGFSGTGAVYIDPSSAGVLTLTKPTAPNVARRVGYILRVNASGLILIDPGEVDENTTYSVFTGASSGSAGSTGLVPQPIAGQQNYRLHGDSTWKSIIVIDDDTSGTPILSTTYAAVPEVVIRRSNGSLGAESQILSGEVFARIGARGRHNSSGYSGTVVKIEARATQAFTNAANGSEMDFYTTADNATSPTRRGYWDKSGGFNVGDNAVTVTPTISIRPATTEQALLNLGIGRTGNGISEIDFYSDSGASIDAFIKKAAGTTGTFEISNTAGELKLASEASGDISFYTGGTQRGLITTAKFRWLDEVEIEGALNHDGTTVGLFGVTPATRPTSTTEIKAGLASMGMLTDGGASPLETDGGYVDVGASYVKIGASSSAGNDRLWQDSTEKMLTWQTASGLKMMSGGVFWKMITATSAITATTETSITGGTVWGTLAIPGSTAVTGTYFEWDFAGLLTASAGNFRFVVKLNGTQIISFQSRAITTGGHFIIRFTAKIVDATGVSNCVVVGNHMSAAGDNITNGGLGSPGNFVLANTNTFTFFVLFDGSPSGQSVTVHTGIGKMY